MSISIRRPWSIQLHRQCWPSSGRSRRHLVLEHRWGSIDHPSARHYRCDQQDQLLVVNPTTATTYFLVATNQSGTTQRGITIQVGFPPVINSFTASDANPLFGAESVLSWTTTNATTISINQGIGAVAAPNGSVSVVPLGTTVYTLSATNTAGTTTANVTVNQIVPIGVGASRFTARRVFAKSTTPFPFSGQGYLQSALSLIGTGPNTGLNELNETTQTGYATVNFFDGVEGDFPSGNAPFPGTGNTKLRRPNHGDPGGQHPRQIHFLCQ